ncbi:MAG: peptidoglycan DD-metalloendopeptidase family protein [Oscillospiraceae bacterium]|nr:peptidoglycan DD-metalloendopeptidase family protein [Oscillospiraceae bacterium]
MRIKKRVLLIAIIFIIIAIPTSMVIAETRETLEGRRIEIQEQILERNVEIEELQERITDQLAQISELDAEIGTHQYELRVLNLQLDRISTEIEEIEEALDRIETNYSLQRNAFQQRVVAQYEAGETRYLEVILSSRTVPELVSNFFLISEIAQYDADLLDTLDRQKIAISQIRETLEQRREDLRDLSDYERRKIVSLENTRVIRNDYARLLTDEEREVQAQIDTFRLALNAVENEIAFLSMESLERIESEFVGGAFAWPTPGNYIITSRFGIRIHPIFRYSRMHSGLDIGAPMRAPVVAANDGVVITSRYLVGYGNTVMIDHGGGVVTLYAHGSELIAEVGDIVRRGQLIMRVGSTGWSTGPHLHFEIRINGVFIDPLPHITRQTPLPIPTPRPAPSPSPNENPQ